MIVSLWQLLHQASCFTVTPSAVSVTPFDPTRGFSTSYQFGFSISEAIPQNAKAIITFPTEYSSGELPSSPACYVGIEQAAECSFDGLDLSITFGTMKGQVAVMVDGITNPNVAQTGNFKVTLQYSNSTWGRTSLGQLNLFTSYTVSTGATYTHDTLKFQETSLWQFTVPYTVTLPTKLNIRFVFPQKFKVVSPRCTITGVAQPKVFTFVTGRSVDCLGISSSAFAGGTAKVNVYGAQSPDRAGTFAGAKAYFVNPDNWAILQTVTMPVVTLAATTLQARTTFNTQFRGDFQPLTVSLLLNYALNQGDYIEMRVAGAWQINSTQFLTLSSVSTTPSLKTSSLTVSGVTTNSLTIQNMGKVSRRIPLAFKAWLVTPDTAASYALTIGTYREDGSSVELYQSSLIVNASIASIERVSVSALRRANKLAAGATGPMEFLLGLGTELPATNVLTWGKIQIQVSPQLPALDPTKNGVVACFFFGTIPAQTCTYDTSDASKTKITIFTPQLYNFKDSQIPLMITSTGFSDPIYEGITLSPVIQRYQVRTLLYSSLNTPTSSTPTEVIFTDFIPDSLTINSHLTITSSCKETYEATHLKVTLTAPVELGASGKIHVLRLEFPNSGAWASYLGFSANTLIEEYPCIGIVAGSSIAGIKCDIYTYTSGPFVQSPATGVPRIDIYGIGSLPAGTVLTVHLPDILHSSSPGAVQNINCYLLEETIGHTPSYITLYSGTITINTLVSRSIASYTTNSNSDFTLTPNTPTPNLSPAYSLSWNTYVSTPVMTRYYYDTSLPDVGTKLLTCGSDTCLQFGMPIQGMVIVHSSASQTVTASIPANTIKHPGYQYTINFKVQSLRSDATIAAKRQYNYPMSVGSVTSTVFSQDLTNNPLLYETVDLADIYKVEFKFQNPIPANGRIVLTLSAMRFQTTYDYCYIVGLTANSQTAVQCVVSGTSTIILQNFAALPAGSLVKVGFKLTSPSSGSYNPTISIYSYYDSAFTQSIDSITNVALQQTPATITTQTQLNSLSLVTSTDPIRAGYKGPLVFTINPRTTSYSSVQTIEITLTNSFSTVGNVLSLPIRCNINGLRAQDVTYTLSPLKFVITTPPYSGTSLSLSSTIELLTELSPQGFNYPTSSGLQLLTIALKDSSANVIEQSTFYMKIEPPKLYYFQVQALHTDTSLPNTFTMRFATSTGQTIPAYSAGGRIAFVFPLSEIGGTAFSSSLGGYTDGDTLDCYTNMTSSTAIQCRLLISPIGQSTQIEILNFNAVSANVYYQLLLFGLTNPSTVLEDILFGLRVYSVDASNVRSTLFSTDYSYTIKMTSPSVVAATDTNTTTGFFQAGSYVGDTNKYVVNMLWSPLTLQVGDVYVTTYPSYLPVTSVSCNNNFFDICIALPKQNQLYTKLKLTSPAQVSVYISTLPSGIYRTATTYQSYLYRGGRHVRTITHTISDNPRWTSLIGSLSGYSVTVPTGTNLNSLQKNVDLIVGFTVQHAVPREGTILVRLPTTFPTIYSQCRSATLFSSTLYAQDGSAKKMGDVGCLLQQTSTLIITGFQALAAGSVVKISISVDLPTFTSTTLGTIEIATYSDTHATNVYDNGRTIDYYSGSMILTSFSSKPTWQTNPAEFRLSSQPLRASAKNPLKVRIRLTGQMSGQVAGSNGYFSFYLYFSRLDGTNSGGFTLPTAPACIITDATTGQQIACKVSSGSDVRTTSAHYYLLLTIVPYQSLGTATDYILTLTSNDASGTPGINFPTVAGPYKCEVYYRLTSTGAQFQSSFQIDVKGPSFSSFQMRPLSTVTSSINPIILKITPAVTIDTDDQLVIEFPTMSLDGKDLMDEDGGMGYTVTSGPTFDLFAGDITSMNCRFEPGCKLCPTVARIICSQFNQAITSARSLSMLFLLKNPAVAALNTIVVPVVVYSLDLASGVKTNWDIVQAGIIVRGTNPAVATTVSDTANFALSDTGYDRSSTTLTFSLRNTKTLQTGDYYILQFNFDLRNSWQQSNAWSYGPSTFAVATSHAYFLPNCRSILLPFTTAFSSQSSGGTVLSGRILSVFYNQYYQLTTLQRTVTAIASYSLTKTSENIVYTDSFPALTSITLSSPTIALTSLRGNNDILADQDYQITVSFSTTDTGTTMKWAKKIAIVLPNSLFSYNSLACVEGPSSSLEVKRCMLQNGVFWVELVQSTSYTNNNNLVIRTMGRALRNPTSSSFNLNTITAYVYSWSSAISEPTLSTSSTDYKLFTLGSTASSTYSFVTSNNYNIITAASVQSERLNDDWEPSSSERTKTAPLKFTILPPVSFPALTSGSHTIKLDVTGLTYPGSTSTTNDLVKFVLRCYINSELVKSCSISSSQVVITHQLSLVAGEQTGIYISYEDPNDRSYAGFSYSGSSPTIRFKVEMTLNTGTIYLVESNPVRMYYLLSTANYPFFGITTATVTLAHNLAGLTNLAEFSLTFARADVTGLVLEIPTVDFNGNTIYSDTNFLSKTSSSRLPCSVGLGKPVRCWYDQPTSTQPIRIYVAGFNLETGSTLTLRILLDNPDTLSTHLMFNLKAYGGTSSNINPVGDHLIGQHLIFNQGDYMVTAASGSYTQTGAGDGPQYASGEMNKNPTLRFYNQPSVQSGDFLLLYVPLKTTSYGQRTCTTNTQSMDEMFFEDSTGQTFTIMVYQSGSAVAANNWYNFGYINCRHYESNFVMVHLKKSVAVYTTTHKMHVSIQQSQADSTVSMPGYAILDYDIQSRVQSQSNWHVILIETSGLYAAHTNALINQNNNGDGRLQIEFITNGYISSYRNDCRLQSGVWSRSRKMFPSCSQSNSIITIQNFDQFDSSHDLKIHIYVYNNGGSNPSNIQVKMTFWADDQSLNYPIFRRTTAVWQAIYQLPQYSADVQTWNKFYGSGTMNADAVVLEVTSSVIDIKLTYRSSYGNGNDYSPSSAQGYYYTHFQFSIPWLTINSCNTGQTGVYSSWRPNGHSWTDNQCYVRNNQQIRLYFTNAYFERQLNEGGSAVTVGNGHYVRFRVAGSFTRVDTSSPDAYYVSATHYSKQKDNYYAYTDDCYHCGVYWDGFNSHCDTCSHRSFTWNSRQFFSGSTSIRPLTLRADAGSSGADLVQNKGGSTSQLSIYLSGAATSIGGKNLLMVTLTGSWTSNNAFYPTYNSEYGAEIQCLCSTSTSTASKSFVAATCYRYLESNPIITVDVTVSAGGSVRCYFPAFVVLTSSFTATVGIMNEQILFDFWQNPNGYYQDSSVTVTVNNAGYSTQMSISDNLGTGETGSLVSSYSLTVNGMAVSYSNMRAYIVFGNTGPVPDASMCSSATFSECRPYSKGINGLYFLVITTTQGSAVNYFNTITSSSAYRPITKDSDTGNNIIAVHMISGNTLVAFNQITRGASDLSVFNNVIGSDIGPYGSRVRSYAGLIVLEIPFGSRTLYGTGLFGTDSGDTQGSKMYITLGTLASVATRCFAYFTTTDSPLLCSVSGTTMTVTSEVDITSSGSMVIHLKATNPDATSVTIQATLYSRYISGSDYSISLQDSVTHTIDRQSGKTIVDRSQLDFKKFAPKNYLTSSINVKARIKPLVTVAWNQDTTLIGKISIYMAGIVSSNYYCWIKQFSQDNPYNYMMQQVPCTRTTNLISFSPINGLSFSSSKTYQLVGYRWNNAANGYVNQLTANFYNSYVYVYGSQSTIHSVAKLFASNAQALTLFQLNSLYLLTLQTAVSNALMIDITLNFVGGSKGFLQFFFSKLSADNLGISDGDEYPCTLQSTVTTFSSRTVRCVAFRQTSVSVVGVRVLLINLGSFASGTNVKLTIDKFTNPSGTQTGQIPFDLQVRYHDQQNERQYTKYFPGMFVIDSTIVSTASSVTTNAVATSSLYGASGRQDVTVNWPVSTTSSDSSAKVLLQLQGGLLCCINFNSITITDSNSNVYPILWTNPSKNLLILSAPTQSASTLTLRINGVVNPYPYQETSYTNSNVYIYKLNVFKSYTQQLLQGGNQPAYSTFGINSGGVTLGAFSYYRLTTGFNVIPQMQFHLQLTLAITPATFTTRKIGSAVIKFTSGVYLIKNCRILGVANPSPRMACAVSKSGSQWFLTVGGLYDSTTATSVILLIRMAFSTNSVPYVVYAYQDDGKLQFQSSSTLTIGSYSVARTFSGTGLSLSSMKYFDQNYELQVTEMIPTAGLTAKSIDIQFTNPFAMVFGDTFNVEMPSTTIFKGANTPTQVFCSFLPSTQSNVAFGMAIFSTCSYDSATGIYSLTLPLTSLTSNTITILRILEINDQRSSFLMPTAAGSQLINLRYISQSNPQPNLDSLRTQFYMRYSSVSFSLATTMANARSGHYMAFTTTAISAPSATEELVLQARIMSRYLLDNLDSSYLLTFDGDTHNNGHSFSLVVSPTMAGTIGRVVSGQYTNKYAPVKLVVSGLSALATTAYTFRMPLLKTAATVGSPYIVKLRLLKYGATSVIPEVLRDWTLQNTWQTVSTSISSFTPSISFSGCLIQSTCTGSLTLSTEPNVNYQVMLKISNQQVALTNIASLAAVTTAYYSSEYYPKLNLLLLRRTSATATASVSLGSYPTASQVQNIQFSLAVVLVSNTNMLYTESVSSIALGQITSLSGTSATLVEGTNTLGSYRMVTYTFTTPIIPASSTIQLSFTRDSSISVASSVQKECAKLTGFVQNGILRCRVVSGTLVRIEGFAAIASGTTVSVSLYIQNAVTVASSGPYVTIKQTTKNLLSSGYTTVSLLVPNTNGLNLALGSTSRILTTNMQQIITPFINLATRSNSIAVNDVLTINFDGWTLGDGNHFVIDKTASYRSNLPVTKVNSSTVQFSFLHTHSVGTLVDLQFSNYFYTDFSTLTLQSAYGWNRISAELKRGSTVLQKKFTKMFVEPAYSDNTAFQFWQAATSTSARAPVRLTFTPTIALTTGMRIRFQFQTNNGRYVLFPTNLGYSTAGKVNCFEPSGSTVISSGRPTCSVIFGVNSYLTPSPAIFQVNVDKAVAAGASIVVYFTALTNPASNSYRFKVAAKVMTDCEQGDQTSMCVAYQVYKYYTLASTTVASLTTSGTYSNTPTTVYLTASHTFTNTYTSPISSLVRVIFDSSVTLTVCTTSDPCVFISQQNAFYLVLSSAKSVFTFGDIRNVYVPAPGVYTTFQTWSGGSLTRYNRVALTATLVTSTVTVTPIRTGDLYLVSFDNLVKIEVANLYTSPSLTHFKVSMPSQVDTVASNYCYAYFVAQAISHKMVCTISNSPKQLLITKGSYFPAFDNSFLTGTFKVYADLIFQGAAAGTTTSNFLAYTYANSNVAATQLGTATGTVAISSLQSPPIYDTTFNTQSFNQRLCRINDQCMFYLYLKPHSSVTAGIDRIVFTAPKQFKYQPITSLDDCTMRGFTTTNINECSTSVNLSIFRVNYVPATYDATYKIITLADTNTDNLFTAPSEGGIFYQLGIDLYSGTTLLQKQSPYLSKIYGDALAQATMSVSLPLDPSVNGLYTFGFKVGTSLVPGSFESDITIQKVSTIEIVFNLLNWPADLGTGLSSNDEVPCLPLLGLTTIREGKLTCRIIVSTKSTENPTILVTGFDAIPAQTSVRLAVDNLVSLKLGIYDTITLGVRIAYRSRNLLYGYLYEPTGIVAGPSTASNIKPASATVTEAGSKTVGSLASYSISFDIPSNGAAVTPTDYLRVQFPALFFDTYNTKASTVTCTGAGSCLLFLNSNHLYIQPSATLSPGTQFTFSVKNLGWTSYKMVRQMTVRVESIVQGKIDAQADVTISKKASPCSTMVGALVSPSSNGGGDSNLNYTFSFKPSVPPPPHGTFTLQFPSEYQSLLSLNSTCNLLGVLSTGNSSCWASSASTITISLNDTTLQAQQQYNFVVQGVTNPNGIGSSSTFALTSHYDQNTYLGQTICETTFSPPALSVVQIGKCDVSASPSITTESALNNLTLSILCPALIGNGTYMKVYVPEASGNSSIQCAASRLIMMQDYCPIKQSLLGKYVEVQLRQIGSFSAFTVELLMINPAPGNMSIKLQFERGLFVSKKGQTSLKILSSSQTDQPSTLTLQNYPTNPGMPATFIFSVSNIATTVSPNKAALTFPSGFVLGTITGCKFMQSDLKLTYKQALGSTQFSQVECKVNALQLTVAIPEGVKAFVLAVMGLRNPNKMLSSFNLQLRLDTQLLQNSQHQLFYSISSASSSMSLQSIALSTDLTNYPSRYTFQMNASGYNLAASTLLITLQLPSSDMASSLSTFVIAYNGLQQQLAGSWSSLMSVMYSQVTIPATAVLNSFTVSVYPINNPSSGPLNTSGFRLQMINADSRQVWLNSVNRNSDSTLNFTDISEITVIGPAIAYAGQVVTFSIVPKNRPANLTIKPVVATEGIATFSPLVATFNNFTTERVNFTLALASTAPDFVEINFVKSEPQPFRFSPPKSYRLQVLRAFANQVQITIEQKKAISIGLPIPLSVSLSSIYSQNIYVNFKHNCSTFYEFNPSTAVLINAGEQQSSLEITYKGVNPPALCQLTFTNPSSTITLRNNKIMIASSTFTATRSVQNSLVLVISSNMTVAKVTSDHTITSKQSAASVNQLAPVVQFIKLIESYSGGAYISVQTNFAGVVYWAVIQGFTNISTQALIDGNSTYITSGRNSTIYKNVHSLEVKPTGLKQNTGYSFVCTMVNSLGQSPVKSVSFRTGRSSDPTLLKLSLSQSISSSLLLSALSSATSLPTSQLALISNHTQSTTYNSDPGLYIVTIAIAPSSQDGGDSPLKVAEKIAAAGSVTMAALVSGLSPVKVSDFSYVEIKKEQPKIAVTVGLKEMTDHSITVNGSFYQPVFVHGIALQNGSSCPMPQQIIQGQNSLNTKLSDNLVSTYSAQNGKYSLVFSGLSSNTIYYICITAEELLPYQPRLKLPLNQTMGLAIKTVRAVTGLTSAELGGALDQMGISTEIKTILVDHKKGVEQARTYANGSTKRTAYNP